MLEYFPVGMGCEPHLPTYCCMSSRYNTCECTRPHHYGFDNYLLSHTKAIKCIPHQTSMGLHVLCMSCQSCVTHPHHESTPHKSIYIQHTLVLHIIKHNVTYNTVAPCSKTYDHIFTKRPKSKDKRNYEHNYHTSVYLVTEAMRVS
jgi:hypothetical protein